MKKITTVLLITVCIWSLIGCSGITIERDTPIHAAKSLVQAMIDQDIGALETIMTKSRLRDSPKEMVLISKSLGMDQMNIDDFTFENGSQPHNVIVKFKDTNNLPVKWKLYFRKSDGAEIYTFGEFTSGRVYDNSTPIKVAKAFMLALHEQSNLFLGKILDKKTGRGLGPWMGMAVKFGIPNQEYKKFDYKNGSSQVDVTFTKKDGDKYTWSIPIGHTENGYYASGVRRFSPSPPTNDTAKSAVKNFLLKALLEQQPSEMFRILQDHYCQISKSYIDFAENHGIEAIRYDPDSKYQKYHLKTTRTSDGADVLLTFNNQKGKEENWTFNFVEKEGKYYLSGSDIVSLDPNKLLPGPEEADRSTPLKSAKLLIKGLIMQNPEYTALPIYNHPCQTTYSLLQKDEQYGFSQKSMSDFTFELGADKKTVIVKFKDSSGKMQRKTLRFKQSEDENDIFYMTSSNFFGS